MPELNEKIAIELLKPTAGLISAALGPTIEHVKQWAQERELKGTLDPDKLALIMKEYLEKLALRVSEITSIAFPLKKLNIFEAYEPLILCRHYPRRYDTKDSININDIICEGEKSFLVIDDAGMGKSTFSKYIVASLLFKSSRIPIFFELRKIDQEIDLIENLAKELDFPGKLFNRDLFYRLIQLGKFYVIIDGFDEVPLDYQLKLSHQINDLSIKGGQNVILLTSRPQEALPDIVKSEALKFKPFTKAQALSLLSRYDSLLGLNVGKDLSTQIDSVPERFIESPLLVSLLYKTFGVNNSIADRACTFYEEIYHALYKGHDLLNKSGYGREKKSKLDFEDFRRLTRTLSYLMMIKKKTSFESYGEAISFIEQAQSICSIVPSSPSNFLDDLMVSVPLMYKEGHEIKFFHKTLLEYFSAEYIHSNKSSYQLLHKIFSNKISTSFNKTFEFLFEMNSLLFDSVITAHYANLALRFGALDTRLEQILKSCVFVKNCKIGLWDLDKYSVTVHGNDEPIFSGKANNIEMVDNGFRITTWSIGKLEKKKYFLAVSFTDIFDSLHVCAWNSISEKIDTPNMNGNDISNQDMKLLNSVLGINKWNDLNLDMVDKIKKAESIIDLIYSVAADSGFSGIREVRVLSTDKINEVIEKIRREDDFLESTEYFA